MNDLSWAVKLYGAIFQHCLQFLGLSISRFPFLSSGCDSSVRNRFVERAASILMPLKRISRSRKPKRRSSNSAPEVVATKRFMRQPTITAVDLFCGAGGLTKGLLDAGIKVRLGVDLDKHCRHPYEANNAGAKFLLKDVSKLKPNEIAKAWGASDVRLLAGCAPCQPTNGVCLGHSLPSHPCATLTSSRWKMFPVWRNTTSSASFEVRLRNWDTKSSGISWTVDNLAFHNPEGAWC
jgi:hypothetical protein